MSTGADPFATAALRGRVLAAWAASPARFREDANAEDDLARGGYRDRLVVELAQNAADAALRAGRPGRLRLELAGGLLAAANVGAPLDAAGVEALATLRASAKRDDVAGTAGRFGVGFAAVLAVCDEPAVRSRDGGVRWSAVATHSEVSGLGQPLLTAELDRRGGAVPVLRLPWPEDARPAEGWDTEVVLPLRDDAAAALVRGLLASIDPALLLALPALAEVEVVVDGVRRLLTAARTGDDVLVTDDGERSRWRVRSATGRLDRGLLAARPVEERERTAWEVMWALPVTGEDRPDDLPASVPRVVHSPTPTDEPLSLPALLVASLPLDPSRRHVAPGPLRDAVLARAAETFVGLLRELPPSVELLTLVPQGLAAGEVDAVLRRELLALLPETPFLGSAADPAARLRPVDALAADLPAAAVGVLAEVAPGLLPAEWSGRSGPLAVLGVRRWGLADVVDALGALERPPEWWRGLYAALAETHLGGPERDALGALPVPLADGRLVTGPRGLLLPEGKLDPAVLGPLGLRLVDPAAAHPLLQLLGAVPATPRAVLDDPRVRAAVAASYDAEDPQPVADAVLGLVATAGLQPGEEAWLADLALPGDDGEVYPAGELLLPGGGLAGVVAADAPFGRAAPALVERWGAAVLEAVGVLDGFALLRAEDVLVDPDAAEHDLDGEERWLAELAELAGGELPGMLPELLAVRDLELVDPQRWAEALALLAAPPLREAVVTPARVVRGADGVAVTAPSYTAWWLSLHPVLAGRLPGELRVAGGDARLAGLVDVVPASELDDGFLRALGVCADLADLPTAWVLERLADPARRIGRAALRAVLAEVAARGDDPPPPDRVRAVRAGAVVLVPAGEAVVVDAPDLLPLLGDRAIVPAALAVAEDVADLLAVPVASELARYELRSVGTPEPVPEVTVELLGSPPPRWWRHAALRCADADGREVAVGWRLVDGEPHATGPDGLARALAWAAARWELRHALAAVLREPAALATVLGEADLDAP